MAAPDFLTVEEAARVLRIGRTSAYQLATLFLRTEGREGLPVIRVGRQLRVPRGRLEAWVGGPLSPAEEPVVVELDEHRSDPAARTSVSRARRHPPATPTLPFTG